MNTRSTALAVVILAATVLLSSVPTRGEAAGPRIDIYFMSALARSGTVDWCTGSGSPVIHNPGRAIDVIGDDSGSLCSGEVTNYAALRAWGFGGTSSHLTMRAYAAGGISQGMCDVVTFGMIDVMGGLHGELQYLHSSNTTGGSSLDLYAGPFPGQQRTRVYGATTLDNDGCGWTTRHVHQGTIQDCMTINNGLGVSTAYSVWDIAAYINHIAYNEGNGNCN
ncbi:MAG: hypothetical protein HYX50_05965 [Chloroflexi bacterium]|nr:hypothetical protein [Chloroflexota bacterium]